MKKLILAIALAAIATPAMADDKATGTRVVAKLVADPKNAGSCYPPGVYNLFLNPTNVQFNRGATSGTPGTHETMDIAADGSFGKTVMSLAGNGGGSYKAWGNVNTKEFHTSSGGLCTYHGKWE
jgi:hypothetical protein